MPSTTASGHLESREGARGKVWTARLRLPDGSQRRMTLGKDWTQGGRPPEGYVTRRMAEAKVRELVVEADRGNVVRRERSSTFGEACADYLDYIANDRQRRHSTVLNLSSLVNNILLPTFGADTALDKLTAEVVDGQRRTWVDAGLAATTVNKRLVTLSGIFKRAGVENPCKDVERQPFIASGEYRAYEPAQVLALANNAPDPYADLFIFAAFSGLRMGELRALRFKHVDRKAKLIHVERSYSNSAEGMPKSGKVRSVPLVDQAAAALDRIAERGVFVAPDELVFLNLYDVDGETIGARLDDSKVRKVMKQAQKAAKLDALTFHDLRHTFGTLMARVLPIHDVQRIMGHADIQTTMIYLHSKPMVEQTDKLNDLINGALKPDLRPVDDERKAA
jgi:integrase